MNARLVTLLFLVFGLIQPSFAYYLRYLPLDGAELRLRVPQRRVADFERPQLGKEVKVGSMRIRIAEEGIVFSGVDRSGNPWKLTTGLMMGGTLWQADLDKNGHPDLILAKFTGGNGLAPTMHLVFVMFDSQERPVPWQVDGYFEYDDRGIKDLLDLNQIGQAQLVRQAYDEGYWITSLYEARDAHWQIVRGAYAGRSFPLHTRFTNRANREPTAPLPGRSPTEDDLSNNLPDRVKAVTVRRLHWEEPGYPHFTLSDSRVCQPNSWFRSLTVVIDRAYRRDTSVGDVKSKQQLLTEIFHRGLPVVVGGHRRDRELVKVDCGPEWLWATDEQPQPPSK